MNTLMYYSDDSPIVDYRLDSYGYDSDVSPWAYREWVEGLDDDDCLQPDPSCM